MADESGPTGRVYGFMTDARLQTSDSGRMRIFGGLVDSFEISIELTKPDCPGYIAVISINHSSKIYYYRLSLTHGLLTWARMRLGAIRTGGHDSSKGDILGAQFLDASF